MNNLNTQKLTVKIKKAERTIVEYLKKLRGDPHYVAAGMAAGVFVAVTPTIPFHTALAVLLAALIRGSKAAAIIGVWFSNPFTIPVLYVSSYKLGMLLLGKESSFDMTQINHISDILKIGLDVTGAMIIGGLLLGIVPSISAYFITKWTILLIKKKDKNK